MGGSKVSTPEGLVNPPKTRSEFVYELLRDKIVSGQIGPGDRIDQSALTKELGVSETPIREALKQLSSEGLVLYKPHTGAVVKKVTREEMQDILEVRATLEIIAAEKSMPLLQDSDIEYLRDSLDKMQNALNEGNFMVYGELNKRFHLKIYSRCSNAFLVQLVTNLWDRTEIARSVFKLSPERMSESYRDHEELIALIEAKSFYQARLLLEQHKSQTFSSYLRNIQYGVNGQ